MAKRRVMRNIVAIGALVCGLAVPVLAQHSATVVLRSGDRVSGDLIDYNASGFVMRVNGQDRSFSSGEVASVELTGGRTLNADQQAKLNGGGQFLLLNDGSTVDGRLYDIGGRVPLTIAFDTPSGRRDFSSNDVAGIYVAGSRSTQAGVTPPRTPPIDVAPVPAGAVIVAGNQQWTQTSVNVAAGETVRFQANGEIRFTGDANDRSQPAGSLNQKRVGGAPIPSALAGALIGRVNNGAPFAIGNQASVRMPAGGTLFLGINDDNTNDNSGQYNVVISQDGGTQGRTGTPRGGNSRGGNQGGGDPSGRDRSRTRYP